MTTPKGPPWLRWSPQPLGKYTGEQLHNLVYDTVSGDPLSVLGLGHNGSPIRVDENGDSKQAWRALTSNGFNFDDLAGKLASPSGRLSLFVSTRKIISSKRKGKEGQKRKLRPIDIPSEAKRFDQLAMMVFTLIPLVVEKHALDPRVVGFRSIREFNEFSEREDGVTIQDVFAHTMQQLIRENGPYVLLIDLMDAYGNLPHKAINIALKELLGLNHDDRRRITESARIRTRMSNGKVFKPRGFGIEQGSPIGPLLFNLVQTLIARRLKTQGFESGCFGDDIGIAARTKPDAKRAFSIYGEILGDLGFNLDKLRGLGDPGEKASYIYDARDKSDSVPLISTYLVTIDEISLQLDKELTLISDLPANPSFKQVRRMNRWKMVSKSYLRRLHQQVRNNISTGQQVESVKDKGPATPILNEPMEKNSDGVLDEPYLIRDQDTAMPLSTSSSSCLQMDDLGDDDHESLLLYPYQDDANAESSLEYTLDAGKTVKVSSAGTADEPIDGRISAPRDGSDIGVIPDDDDVEVDGHPVSTSKPVFTFIQIRDEHVDLLAAGRALKAGDAYRRGKPRPKGMSKKQWKKVQAEAARVILDIRQVGGRVSQWRCPWAVRQLVRVASTGGRAGFLVHPGDLWFQHLMELDGDGHRVGVREDMRGVIVTVWKMTTHTNRLRPKIEQPPAAEITIECIRRSRENRRSWRVKASTAYGVRHETFTSKSFDHTIGVIEIVALALAAWQPKSMAFPAFGQVHRLLSGKVRLRQADLHRAVESMSEMRFKKASVNWMLATRQ
jgi:hypothetical protein